MQISGCFDSCPHGFRVTYTSVPRSGRTSTGKCFCERDFNVHEKELIAKNLCPVLKQNCYKNVDDAHSCHQLFKNLKYLYNLSKY